MRSSSGIAKVTKSIIPTTGDNQALLQSRQKRRRVLQTNKPYNNNNKSAACGPHSSNKDNWTIPTHIYVPSEAGELFNDLKPSKHNNNKKEIDSTAMDNNNLDLSEPKPKCKITAEIVVQHVCLPLSLTTYYQDKKSKKTTATFRARRHCIICHRAASYYCKKCSTDPSHFLVLCNPATHNCWQMHIQSLFK